MSIMLHCGAKAVDYEEVCDTITPPETASWTPVPHHDFFTLVRGHVERVGYTIADVTHALDKGGARYYAFLELAGQGEDDWRPYVGLRNSHDKAFSASFAVGSRVFICDNLAISGEHVFRRRHTKNILDALDVDCYAASKQLATMINVQADSIAQMKASVLDSNERNGLIIELARQHVIAPSQILKVLDACGDTQWSLFNAVTACIRGVSIMDIPRRTLALHAALSEERL